MTIKVEITDEEADSVTIENLTWWIKFLQDQLDEDPLLMKEDKKWIKKCIKNMKGTIKALQQ